MKIETINLNKGLNFDFNSDTSNLSKIQPKPVHIRNQ